MNSSPRKNSTDNRRDFLRESLMLAAMPAGLAGGLVQAAVQAQVAAPVAELKLGLLGCGRRGLQLTKAALASQNAKVRLAAMADLFADRIQQTYRTLNSSFADQLEITSATRLTGMRAAELLAGSDVDAVLVTAASGVRPQQVRLLTEAGKHVFVECPVAVDREGIEALTAIAENASHRGVSVYAGSNYPHQPFYASLVEQLRQGIIGELLIGQAIHHRSVEAAIVGERRTSDHELRWRNWQRDQRLGGHPHLADLSNSLSLFNWIANDLPVKLGSSSPDSQVDFVYPRGLRLNCQFVSEASSSHPTTVMQIQGTRGWCDITRGRIYDSANRLIGSASGSPSDVQPMIDAWLSMLGQAITKPDSSVAVESLSQFRLAASATMNAIRVGCG